MYAGHEGGAYAKNSFGNMYAHDRLRLPLGFHFLFSLWLMLSFFFFDVNNGHAVIQHVETILHNSILFTHKKIARSIIAVVFHFS